MGHNIIQDMFEKLKQLDRANVSLSDLIIASKNGVNLVEKSPDKNEMLANEDHAQADVNVIILTQNSF